MKRILMLMVALTLIALAAPVAASPPWDCDDKPNHPICNQPTPEFEDCVFIDGVLQGWNVSSPLRCRWIGVPDAVQTFQIEMVSAGRFLLPYLAVTSGIGGDRCEAQDAPGWHTVYQFAEFNPSSGPGACATTEEFALTVMVQKVRPKVGTVNLVWN